MVFLYFNNKNNNDDNNNDNVFFDEAGMGSRSPHCILSCILGYSKFKPVVKVIFQEMCKVKADSNVSSNSETVL